MPKTRSTHVLQTQRLDPVFKSNSIVSGPKSVRKKREVKMEACETEIFKGAEKPAP